MNLAGKISVATILCVLASSPLKMTAATWDEAVAQRDCQKDLKGLPCAFERCVWQACIKVNSPSIKKGDVSMPTADSQMEIEAIPVCLPHLAAVKSCVTRSQASSDCMQWDLSGRWAITQSNGYNPSFDLHQKDQQLEGQATLGSAVGALTGSVIHDHFDVLVTWPTNRDGSPSLGRYTGQIVAGEITTGETHDEVRPTSHATWSGKGPARCLY